MHAPYAELHCDATGFAATATGVASATIAPAIPSQSGFAAASAISTGADAF